MLFIFYFRKKARASSICKRFLFPESNEGRQYRNSAVDKDENLL